MKNSDLFKSKTFTSYFFINNNNHYVKVKINNIVLYNIGCEMMDEKGIKSLGICTSFTLSSSLPIWCGCVIISTGILSGLTTHYKSNTL